MKIWKSSLPPFCPVALYQGQAIGIKSESMEEEREGVESGLLCGCVWEMRHASRLRACLISHTTLSDKEASKQLIVLHAREQLKPVWTCCHVSVLYLFEHSFLKTTFIYLILNIALHYTNQVCLTCSRFSFDNIERFRL